MKKSEVKKPLTLRDLKGLGKEIWKDVDVEDYIKKERESWQITSVSGLILMLMSTDFLE